MTSSPVLSAKFDRLAVHFLLSLFPAANAKYQPLSFLSTIQLKKIYNLCPKYLITSFKFRYKPLPRHRLHHFEVAAVNMSVPVWTFLSGFCAGVFVRVTPGDGIKQKVGVRKSICTILTIYGSLYTRLSSAHLLRKHHRSVRQFDSISNPVLVLHELVGKQC